MTCDTREQELLLLAHGELPLLRRFAVRQHVARCPACRERYARLSLVSALLAGGVRGPESPLWSPALNRAGAGMGQPVRAARIALLILALCAGVLTIYVVSGRRAPLSRTPATGAQGIKFSGCAPDLLSNKCADLRHSPAHRSQRNAAYPF